MNNQIRQPHINRLISAVRHNKSRDVEFLLDGGVPVDGTNERGRTALYYAVHENAVKAAKILIKKGADINFKNKFGTSTIELVFGDTPLEFAKKHGSTAMRKLFEKKEMKLEQE